MSRGVRLAVVGLVACAIGVAVGLPWFPQPVSATPGGVAEDRAGERGPQPRPKGMTFTDHTGRAVSEREFSGHYMLVFFGYTHCPDVCPANLAIMSAALRILGSAAEAVQPLFITFDPVRDTPEVLAEYVRHFHPRLTGLTGTREEIGAAARSYGVLFERDEDEDGAKTSDYSLRHTALTYLIGPDGKGVASFGHGSNPTEMAAKILALLEQDPVGTTTEGSP